jgi:hypothetical protein
VAESKNVSRRDFVSSFPVDPATMRRRYQKIGLRKLPPRWERFDFVRTKETGGDHKLLLNHVRLRKRGNSTHRVNNSYGVAQLP